MCADRRALWQPDGLTSNADYFSARQRQDLRAKRLTARQAGVTVAPSANGKTARTPRSGRPWIRAAGTLGVLAAVTFAGCGDGADVADKPSSTTATTAISTSSTASPTTTLLPITGSIRVEGDLVRGAPASAVLSGLPTGTELTLVVSDAGQRVPVAEVTPIADGAATVSFVVPSVGLHEGICVDGGPCEYRPFGLGVHQLSVGHSAYDLSGALTIDVEIGSARRNVAYPVSVTGECGPVRTELDGRAWIADTPDRFDPPGEPALTSLAGTLTLTGNTTAVFKAENGATGRFTAGDRSYC